MSERLVVKGGCLIFPDTIDSDTYSDFLSVVLRHLDKPLYIFIEGNGGNSSHGFAIYDTIKMHGNVTGILTGGAMSAHATIFAACQKRYVYPSASIGVHQCGWAGDMDIDANRLRLLLEEFDRVDWLTCIALSEIAKEYKPEFWMEKIKAVGNRDFFIINALMMINIFEMAKPVIELDKKCLIKAQQLKKSVKALPTKTSSN